MSAADIAHLLSTRAIRERAARIHALALKGKTNFSVQPERLPEIAEFVAQVTRENYPDLKIPFHSRWRHFQVAGVDRLALIADKFKSLTPEERVKSELDLVVVSVLLDAGAGDKWRYSEAHGTPVGRSEGLAVASLHMFLDGAFSSQKELPYRADAQGLASLNAATLAKGFQVSEANPLVGFDGRLELLKSLGRVLASNPEYFPSGRPGDLAEFLKKHARGGRGIRATEILTAIQRGLGAIWPGRVSLDGFNLGDVWTYAPLGKGLDALVPFHKLSQWLTYSVVDPLEKSGLQVSGFDELTGLAEYRNGGLLLDMGLLTLRDPSKLSQMHAPESELVVEWRALTVVLLEQVANDVRRLLGRSEDELPLGKVLEGGTWWAGRKIAAQLRPGGGPPIKIQSDGTVF